MEKRHTEICSQVANLMKPKIPANAPAKIAIDAFREKNVRLTHINPVTRISTKLIKNAFYDPSLMDFGLTKEDQVICEKKVRK